MLLILSLTASAESLGWPRARLAVHVTDEQGRAVPDAEVKIFFRQRFSDDNAWITGKTDSEGRFSGEGYSDMRLGGSVAKPGYYLAGLGWTIFKASSSGQWEPRDTVVEVVLRAVGKPVALAAKRVQTEVPALNQPCGYDLEKGDWVIPYGHGMHSDLIFVIQRDYKDWSNFEVNAKVTFSQPLDGLIRMHAPAYAHNSAFSWEREAPEIGYLPSHSIHYRSLDLHTHVDREMSFDTTHDRESGYFFRVRSIEQNGRLTAANFGKITGDIAIDPRDTKTCYILFTYYVNLESLDRNLEWDPKQNLLRGLTFLETPHDP
ncbi:MAG TPA: carboxypeptidase-like regulatory domain-containing protein [Candidatus Didemnitutus sp.]|nr:carboxypeptidase-like regulatory domain-containing protein [Candidatus Didemnitutus sp.]